VIYDLPWPGLRRRLASNGEIPATAAGLTEYESQYIDPIASILNQFASSPIRVVAIIEPDSLAERGHQPVQVGVCCRDAVLRDWDHVRR